MRRFAVSPLAMLAVFALGIASVSAIGGGAAIANDGDKKTYRFALDDAAAANNYPPPFCAADQCVTGSRAELTRDGARSMLYRRVSDEIFVRGHRVCVPHCRYAQVCFARDFRPFALRSAA